MKNSGPKKLPLIIACSGRKPVGDLADKIARRLDEEGVARMVSFAGLSSNIFEGSQAALAPRLIVIDGCHSECAKNAMQVVGFDNCECVDLLETGIIGPNTDPSDLHVERGVKYIRELIAGC